MISRACERAFGTLTLAGVLIACAPAAPHRIAPRPRSVATITDGAATAFARGQDVPSLDTLAARGPTDMPLMREVLRVPMAATKPSELESKSADACFCAVVAASFPVRAWFEDDKHAPRGEVAPAATSALVPPRGPACARKGETLRLMVEPSSTASHATLARAVVWQAP